MKERLERAYTEALRDISKFAILSGVTLRSYQVRVAETIIHSIRYSLGLTIVVVFPRQSGKNEIQAHIEAYFLGLYMFRNPEIVKLSPTWKPQSQNAMRRLERVLRGNILLKNLWVKEQSYTMSLDEYNSIAAILSITASGSGKTLLRAVYSEESASSTKSIKT